MPTNDQIADVAKRALTHFQLWRGSGRALTREELCRALGCDDRVLRYAVRELRCQGYLIVAESDGGYRFAREGSEVYGYVATLTSRIQALREVVEAMRVQAEVEFGPPGEQLALW